MKADVNVDKLIHLTFFPDQWARTLTPEKMTLPALRDLILETSAPSKAALPWLKLASFGKEQSEERCLRHDANMHTISGIEIDYDGQLMSFDEAEGRLASAGLATLLYTTSSHTEAAPRWRALLPSSTELPPGERRKLVARVNGVLGGVISSESFTLSQAFFYGAVAGQPAPHVELIEGDYIDLRDDLDANAIDDNEPYSNEPLQGSPFEIARTGFVDEKVERLVAEPLQKPHRSTRFAHAVMKAVECGMTAADFEALCRENLQGCAQKYLPPERRRDELRKHIAKIWQPHERVVELDRWIAKQCEQILATAGRKAASLPFINMSNWDNEAPPAREWAVPGRIPLRQTSLFSGEGAIGKSTVQLHECAAHALAREWLGVIPMPGPAIFLDAEDDPEEIWRRLAAIVRHYGVSFKDLINGGLHLISLVGEDAVLATASRSGKVEPTPRYRQLLEAAGDIKPRMIGIASSANVFAGEENSRPQVQQFIGLLTKLAIVANGAVQLISHPSLTGINSGSGLSGSTQWHNAVRARSYLKGIKSEGSEQPDDGLRELVFKKNNYGPISESLVLRYQNGLYLPVHGAKSLDRAAKEANAEEVFVTLLRRFNRENRVVFDKPGRGYAPAEFTKEKEATEVGLSKKGLEAAMRSLFKSEKIWNEPHGKPSRGSFRIALKS